MVQYTNTLSNNHTLSSGIISKVPPTFIENSVYYWVLVCFNKDEANQDITN